MRQTEKNNEHTPNPGNEQETYSRYIISNFVDVYTLEEVQDKLLLLLEQLMGDDNLNEDPIDRTNYAYLVHQLIDLLFAIYGTHAPLKALPFYERFTHELLTTQKP